MSCWVRILIGVNGYEAHLVLPGNYNDRASYWPIAITMIIIPKKVESISSVAILVVPIVVILIVESNPRAASK